MVYLLAVIGAIAVAYLLWRAFGSDRVHVGSSRAKRGVGPDDDPEFLRKLAEQAKRHPEDGNPPG
ncbi:MAG TPA: hypothetical protein VL652_43615 [Kutzneria sp.]|jgi:hypothetical protein|nr:hypothetical protein [Kutzneria sp.]